METKRTESIILAENVDFARELTRFYISKLKGVDMQKSIELGGIKFNSPYWIIGHLAWAQNSLILHSTFGQRVKIDWLKKFKIGDHLTDLTEMPDIKELLDTFKDIHQRSVEHIKTISDADLDKENAASFGFSDDKSVRQIIKHQIRHENAHTGQLGWLCKMYGITTF